MEEKKLNTCPNCKKEVTAAAKFCTHCGRQLKKELAKSPSTEITSEHLSLDKKIYRKTWRETQARLNGKFTAFALQMISKNPPALNLVLDSLGKASPDFLEKVWEHIPQGQDPWTPILYLALAERSEYIIPSEVYNYLLNIPDAYVHKKLNTSVAKVLAKT